MEEYAIEVNHLTKIYKLYKKPSDRMKEAFSITNKTYHKDFYALKDVNFKVKRGEALGIVGKNGSGKSTILKIITGVLQPSIGGVKIDGRIAALLELGAGFNGEYSGFENIYLNGTIMGFTRAEIEKKMPEIIAFADIGDFIYQPVKTYSSGMYVRLAFAIAIHVDPDILIIDEALSVGDIRFQRKCFRKIEEFKKTKTFILVSHDLSSITKFCDRAIWLNEGELKSEGEPVEIAKEFRAYMIEAKFTSKANLENQKIEENAKETYEFESIPKDVDVMGDDKAEFLGMLCMDEEGKKASIVDADSRIKLCFKAHIREEITDAIVGFTFKDKLGTILFQLNTFVMEKELRLEEDKTYIFQFVFTLPKLIDGYYTISPAIASGSQAYHIQHCWIFDAMVIQVLNKRDINLEGYNYIDDAEFYVL